MKLVRFHAADRVLPGVLVDGRIVDVSSQVEDFDPGFFASGSLRDADIHSLDLPSLSAEGVRLAAPVAKTPKIVCIGLNYAKHAAESGAEAPREPVVFFKAPNTLVGPDDDVIIPRGAEKTDWEVELAVIIGETCRYLPDDTRALDHVFGYAVSNDVSERSFQLERGGQWVKGKSCESFNPLGPWLVTADEVGDPQRLDLWLDVNGVRRQCSNTGDMIFSVSHIVWYLSQFMVLEPGDIINTGTPAGVGLGLTPPQYLSVGDRMDLGIEGLGVQHQRCTEATWTGRHESTARSSEAGPG